MTRYFLECIFWDIITFKIRDHLWWSTRHTTTCSQQEDIYFHNWLSGRWTIRGDLLEARRCLSGNYSRQERDTVNFRQVSWASEMRSSTPTHTSVGRHSSDIVFISMVSAQSSIYFWISWDRKRRCSFSGDKHYHHTWNIMCTLVAFCVRGGCVTSGYQQRRVGVIIGDGRWIPRREDNRRRHWRGHHHSANMFCQVTGLTKCLYHTAGAHLVSSHARARSSLLLEDGWLKKNRRIKIEER